VDAVLATRPARAWERTLTEPQSPG
jgi:hypothetical protein